MINYYGPTIFKNNMGQSRNLSLLLGGGMECMYLVASPIPILLMDRCGCRTLLIACLIGMCICFIMVSILL